MNRFFVLICILFLGFTNLFGQNIVLRGTVKDTTIATPLVNANILAFPQNPDENTRFAISNEKWECFLASSLAMHFVIRQSKSTIRKLKRGINQFNGY